MATPTYAAQILTLINKVELCVQSLRAAKTRPPKAQYEALKTLGERLGNAVAAVPVEIESLKNRWAESCEEGQTLISQAQSVRNDIITGAQLKRRVVFARNIKLFFGGTQDSVIDSSATKARKRLTRERCERICGLRPDGVITWAAAFPPSTWTASSMSNSAFDYVEEHIEPGLPVVWPSEIFEILNDLEVEEPLNLSSKYKGFLEAVRRGEQEKLTPAGPVPPSKENREMKHMYTDGPASDISRWPEPFRASIQNSRQWKWERSQGLQTTGCWATLFPKDDTQDVSFTIWCDHDDGYRLIDAFGLQLVLSS